MQTPQSSPQLLAVSFIFTPTATPRALQVGRLLKHLRLSTTLICADDLAATGDSTIEPDAEAALRKCVRVPFSVKGWRRQVDRVGERFRLPVWNRVPDRYSWWQKRALQAIAKQMQSSDFRPDAIVTFGQPMSDHVIGLRLKQIYRLPWLAHFSDPWVDNPFNRYDAWTKRINRSLERKVIETADRVIFTSQETVDLVMAKYPAEWRTKVRVLPHAFEPSINASAAGEESSVITVRHTGEFYGRRTPKPLIETLRSIMSDDPRLLDGVCFELIGENDPATVANLGIEDLPAGLVRFRPPVSYQESCSLSSAANGLLMIDAPAQKSVFLPSKLIEYVGVARPILGITPPGAAANLIKELGGWVADPSSPEAMKTTVVEFLSYLRNSQQSGPWGNPEVRSRYEAPVVSELFEGMVRELLSK
ncbi:MAG TPA: glycosyltransferase [Pyrinomonadaceae bacterium]|nr:glycosyltransferase [Pyrinomonadaceae bacterium]